MNLRVCVTAQADGGHQEGTQARLPHTADVHVLLDHDDVAECDDVVVLLVAAASHFEWLVMCREALFHVVGIQILWLVCIQLPILASSFMFASGEPGV